MHLLVFLKGGCKTKRKKCIRVSFSVPKLKPVNFKLFGGKDESYILAHCFANRCPGDGAGGLWPCRCPATEAPAVPARKLNPPADSSQVPVTAPAGSELARALAGEFKGTTVTMSGPFTDADAIKFEESVKRFEQQTGIKIQYSGSKEFEAEIAIRIEGGNAPILSTSRNPASWQPLSKTAMWLT
jgi:alpha-glucoside transport system substrate-binding protein